MVLGAMKGSVGNLQSNPSKLGLSMMLTKTFIIINEQKLLIVTIIISDLNNIRKHEAKSIIWA